MATVVKPSSTSCTDDKVTTPTPTALPVSKDGKCGKDNGGQTCKFNLISIFQKYILIVSQALATRTPSARLSSAAARNLDVAPLILGHVVLVAIPSLESATRTKQWL
jgi:hypothetical protein